MLKIYLILPLALAHGIERLQQSRDDLVWIGLGVWSSIFHVTLIAGVHEAVWDTNRCTAVGYTVAELVNRLCFVQAGQPQMVVRSVRRDMLVSILVESGHELVKILLTTLVAKSVGREVGMHA